MSAKIWNRMGNVQNYIEPFFGSGAVLLSRPHENPRVETVNDLDAHICNFWRATSKDPEAVADSIDWPVIEIDMHSRHIKMIQQIPSLKEKLLEDEEYFDAKLAGWWCWGICIWIGSGWCVRAAPNKRPCIEGRHGVDVLHGERRRKSKQRPHLGGFSADRGIVNFPRDCCILARLSEDGFCKYRSQWLIRKIGAFRDRLRNVRILTGDWLRVCDSESVTTRLGTTGIFFDPPYGAKAGRTKNIYAKDSDTVAEAVRKYCLERGDNKMMRICLAGYEGEGHEELEENGWSCVPWKGIGYGVRSEHGKENAKKERLWFSPNCKSDRKVSLWT